MALFSKTEAALPTDEQIAALIRRHNADSPWASQIQVHPETTADEKRQAWDITLSSLSQAQGYIKMREEAGLPVRLENLHI